ncbi:recombinase family protein [Saccharopolyspora rosea]|uniref:recombinase family protein n=1 Tax=Saccharopolyspora rosea TaxID=524884 RepID=UPI0021DA60C8|nr:recombinase family protein [Saccharopolyspora rosea]
MYLDHGLTGTTRARPGLDQALTAVRSGDTSVVPKLDRTPVPWTSPQPAITSAADHRGHDGGLGADTGCRSASAPRPPARGRISASSAADPCAAGPGR